MRTKTLALLLIFSILLPLTALSEDPKKDSGSKDTKTKQKSLDLDEVLAKYYKAIGGLEKWRGLNTMVMKGTMRSQDKVIPIVAYHERPGKCRVEYTVQDTMMAQIYGGYFAWQINPLSGNPEPAPMTSGKTAYLKDTCGIENSLIDYKKKGHRIKFLGEEDIQGRRSYKISLRYRSGNLETYYIDAETFMLSRTIGLYNIDQNEIRTTTTFKDYKDTDGYVVPYGLVIEIHGAPSEEFVDISDFSFNPKIDSKMFDFPKDKIQKLDSKPKNK